MLMWLAAMAGAGAVVWWAGTALGRDADALAASRGYDRALVGVLLLGVATSLPEIATTVTAGVLGNAGLATGNLMGGVALQIVVLAAADALVARRALAHAAVQPGILLQHVALLLLLSLAIAGMAVGEPFVVLGLGVWPVALVVLYIGSILLLRRDEEVIRWTTDSHETATPRARSPEPAPEQPPILRIGLSGALILVAGWVLARSGHELTQSFGLNETFVGAALVALATSLPEISTVTASVRAGAYDMAVSNIVGTNTLEVALLFVADVALREAALLSRATSSDIFLAALAAVLTCLYLTAILRRQRRTVGRVGYESVAIVIAYAAGLSLLALS